MCLHGITNFIMQKASAKLSHKSRAEMGRTMGNAYGFFEIPSTTAAIDALDIMCKTADVEFITWEKKLGGRLVTIIIRGSVSDVKQAIEVAAQNAIKKPAATVVIANPHEEIIKLVKKSASRLTNISTAWNDEME